MSVWLGALSAAWSGLSAARRAAARRGWVAPGARLASRVVSVGNLQAGGTGKTPLVALIARQAAERGLNVCILSRGYRGEWESGGGVIAPGQETPSAKLCGDEPALLHELAPQAWLGIGVDRRAALKAVEERAKHGFAWVILDDGFQNHQFQKDLEIVAVTSALRSEAAFRDFEGALRLADLVVWTKGVARPASEGRPFAALEYVLPAPSLPGAPYWAITGVADGQAVVTSLSKSGFDVRKHVSFPDHASYDEKEVLRLIQAASRDGARAVITGKDWVKWRELGVKRGEVEVVEPELRFREGIEQWNRILWDTQR